MYRGEVVWFNGGKGFGFIHPSSGGEDVFVHHSGILMDGYRKLDQGDRVQFDLEEGPNGRPQACNVVVIGKEK